MRAADAVLIDQRRRRLAERASMDAHRQPRDPAVPVELDGKIDPAAAGRRAQVGAPVLALERLGLAKRRREPENLGGVERRVQGEIPATSSFPRKQESRLFAREAGPPSRG
jgi:hypothetical protein